MRLWYRYEPVLRRVVVPFAIVLIAFLLLVVSSGYVGYRVGVFDAARRYDVAQAISSVLSRPIQVSVTSDVQAKGVSGGGVISDEGDTKTASKTSKLDVLQSLLDLTNTAIRAASASGGGEAGMLQKFKENFIAGFSGAAGDEIARRAIGFVAGDKSKVGEAETITVDAPVLIDSFHEIIEFDRNEATLSPDAYVKIERARAYALEHPEKFCLVSGNTDTTGSGAYNSRLAQMRVDAVKGKLIAEGGLRIGQVFTNSLAENVLPVLTEDETSEPRNRVVRILFR